MTLNFTSQVTKKEHHLMQLCLSDSAKKQSSNKFSCHPYLPHDIDESLSHHSLSQSIETAFTPAKVLFFLTHQNLKSVYSGIYDKLLHRCFSRNLTETALKNLIFQNKMTSK